MTHKEPHPLAGKTVVLNNNAFDPCRGIVEAGEEFEVIDWWDAISNNASWTIAQNSNFAAAHYGFRLGEREKLVSPLPYDDEVVYGHIGAFGHLVHTTELGGVANATKA